MNLDLLLSRLLAWGSWIACIVTTAGLAVADMRVVTWGIALFIVLPVLRVTLMLAVFVRQRDYRFMGISALVLLIILAGFALGMRLAPQNG